MGKSQTKIIVLSILFVLGLSVVFYIKFITPQLSEKNFFSQLDQIGLKIESSDQKKSFMGQSLKLNNVLIIDSENIEYPLLKADSLFVHFSTGRIVLKNPEVTLVQKSEAWKKWVQIGTTLQDQGSSLEIENGTIQVWENRALKEVPFQINQLSLKGTLPKLKISFNIPEGFSSLITFASSARFFPQDDYLVSTDLDFSNRKKGKLLNFSLKARNETLFQCSRLEWNVHPELKIDCWKPTLILERSHAKRWRVNDFAFRSLNNLIEQTFGEEKKIRPRISIRNATLLFSDKYVFPLFQVSLEKVQAEINHSAGETEWSLIGQVKNSAASIHLNGNNTNPLSEAQFSDFPIQNFYPYTYKLIPYQKIKGTVSGILENKQLNITLSQFKGEKTSAIDTLKEKTGMATPLLLSLLQDSNNQIQLEFPFQSNWEDPLATYTVLALYNKYKDQANISIVGDKIESIDWQPIPFEANKAKLNQMAQWLSFSESIILTLQENSLKKGISSTSQWAIKIDKKGYRFLTPQTKSTPSLNLNVETGKGRAHIIAERLLKNKDIQPEQISFISTSKQTIDAVNFSLQSK